MLDPQSERRHHEERWQRVRAEVVAERLRDAADASADAADGLFRRINRAISWRPEQWRYRLLLAVPGLAVLSLAYYLVYFHDAPPVVAFVLTVLVPLAFAALTGLIARGYIARQRREEAIANRQRGAR